MMKKLAILILGAALVAGCASTSVGVQGNQDRATGGTITKF